MPVRRSRHSRYSGSPRSKRAPSSTAQGCLEPVDHADLVAVLQVAADPRQIHPDRDAVGAQLRGGADAGQHQQLRRIESAAGEDDLAPRGDPPRSRRRFRRSCRVGAIEVRTGQILDAGRAVPLVEHDAGRERVQLDPQAVRIARGDIEDPLAGADALVRLRRQRRKADALEPAMPEASVVRVGRAEDQRAQAAQRVGGRQGGGARRAEHQPHQIVVAHRLVRQRTFAVEPAGPAVSGRDRSRIGRGGATAGDSGSSPAAANSAAYRRRARTDRRSARRCRPSRCHAARRGSSRCARCSRRACRPAGTGSLAGRICRRAAAARRRHSGGRKNPSASPGARRQAGGTPAPRSLRASPAASVCSGSPPASSRMTRMPASASRAASVPPPAPEPITT